MSDVTASSTFWNGASNALPFGEPSAINPVTCAYINKSAVARYGSAQVKEDAS